MNPEELFEKGFSIYLKEAKVKLYIPIKSK